MLELSYKTSGCPFPVSLYYHDKESRAVREKQRLLEAMGIPVRVEPYTDIQNPYSRKGRERKFNRGGMSRKTSTSE